MEECFSFSITASFQHYIDSPLRFFPGYTTVVIIFSFFHHTSHFTEPAASLKDIQHL